MKKKRILSLALAAALFVLNPAVVLAATGNINGVTVTGNSSAYVASGSASTYMATYCPMVSVSVTPEYKWYDLDTGSYYVMNPSPSAGVSSVLVILTPPNADNCVTEYMAASHAASDGNDSWSGASYASYL